MCGCLVQRRPWENLQESPHELAEMLCPWWFCNLESLFCLLPCCRHQLDMLRAERLLFVQASQSNTAERRE